MVLLTGFHETSASAVSSDWRSSIPGAGTPHIRADKIQQDQILGCFGPSKIVKVILLFEQPFNGPMVWLRASRIRLRFEMAWVLKGLHSCKAFWYSKALGDVDFQTSHLRKLHAMSALHLNLYIPH